MTCKHSLSSLSSRATIEGPCNSEKNGPFSRTTARFLPKPRQLGRVTPRAPRLGGGRLELMAKSEGEGVRPAAAMVLRFGARGATRPNWFVGSKHDDWLRRVFTLFVAITFALPATAQLASRPTGEWIKTLDSSNRVAGLKIDETIAKLKLKPGAVIADVGAGSGAFSIPLAKAVSPDGKVLAVDIDQGLIDHIARKAKEQQTTNVQVVLGKFTDPNLPATDVDLAFIYDVLHHIEGREEYLKNLVGYLKPSGRIAVIDFYPERGPHRKQPELQVTKEQSAAWLAALGFKSVEEFDLFSDKWFVVYSR